MTIQNHALFCFRLPLAEHRQTVVPAFASTTAITAANDAVYMLGTFYHKDGPGAVKNITGLEWRSASTMTWGTGPSNLRISIQSISTSGPVGRYSGTILDDGGATADGYADRTSGAASTWLTETLTGGVDLTVGSDYAVVFQITTLNGGTAPSLGFSGITNLRSDSVMGQWPACGRQASGSYAGSLTQAANLVFVCSDGTYGCFLGALVCSGTNNTGAISSTSAPDEYGFAWTPQYPVKVSGGGGAFTVANNAAADFEFRLTSTPVTSMTSIDTMTGDAATMLGVTAQRSIDKGFTTARTLSADTEYGFTVRATSTSTITVYYIEVDDANHARDLYDGISGLDRDGGTGNYTRTSTRIFPLLWLNAIGFDDGAGGGGGLLAHPGMRGGFV